MTTPATFGSISDALKAGIEYLANSNGRVDQDTAYALYTLEIFLSRVTPPPATAQGWVPEIAAERARQDAKWGGPQHDDEHDQAEWEQFIIERLAELGPCADTFRHRMLEIAALAVAAMESHDRKANQ